MNRRQFIQLSGATMISGGLLPGTVQAAQTSQRWQLTAGPTAHLFEPEQAARARLLGFNQVIPGPVLRLPQGEVSEITVVNQLDQPTAVHWHGLRIDNAMDGVPGFTQAPIAAGDEYRYRLNPPDAGTYWYHSHLRSWEQLARGLAGVLIVEEKNSPSFDQDLVFALDDWRVDDDLQLDEASFGSLHDWAHAGRLGNILTVNGTSVPEFKVISGQRIRLRVINMANARIMTLRLPDDPVWIIAKDGQPIKPTRLEDRRMRLAPGQRLDLAIDMSAAPGSRLAAEVLVRDQVLEVADFTYHATARQPLNQQAPAALPDNPLHASMLPTGEAYLSVPLKLQGGAMGRMPGAIFEGESLNARELARQGQVWAINGFAGFPEQPLFRVSRGTPISLEVYNDNAWPHGMHVHGHHFQDTRDPGAWRDTALFDRGEQGSLKFVADNPGKWLIHCHMLEHQAGGMKTWFEVT